MTQLKSSNENVNQAVLEVSNYNVDFWVEGVWYPAAIDMNFQVQAGKVLAIVGESGSGKTVTSLSVIGLHNKKRTQISGSIKVLDGDKTIDMVTADPETTRSVRGRVASMIFQDPMSSLHPYYKISNQLCESYLVHHPRQKKAAFKKRLCQFQIHSSLCLINNGKYILIPVWVDLAYR